MLEAFASTAADPELPPAGVMVLRRTAAPSTADDADGALAHARDVIWSIVGNRARDHRRLARQGPAAVAGDVATALVVDGESGNPAIGSLKGLIRVLAYEHPDLRATLLDTDEAGDAVATLTAELESSGSDDVIAWRGERQIC